MARRGKAGSSDQSLPEWGPNAPTPQRASSSPPSPPPSPPPKRRRWVRRLGIVLLMLLIVIGVAVAFVPTIASSLAPGIIEGAAKGQIAGSVKVSRVDLSWRGTQKIGPVELRDDKDRAVGTVSATIPVGLLTVITEQWWSKSSIDVGQLEITGDLDVVVQTPGGESNLDRAIAPGPLAKPTKKPASSGGSGGGPDVITGVVKLDAINVTYTDQSAPAGSPMATGVGLLKFGGDIKFTFDQPGGANGTGGLIAKTALAGVLKGGSSTQDKLEINADVDLKQSKTGALDNVKAIVELFGAPIDLIDGIAGFKGELVRSIGSRGEVKLNAAGNLNALDASIFARADGATADLAYRLADGVLSASKPGTISLRRTDFLAALPSLKSSLADVGKIVRLDAGPSVDVSVNTFKLPFPKELLGGGTGASPSSKPSFTDIDLRTAAIELTATVGKQTGEAAIEQLQAGSAASGAPNSPAPMTPFEVEPLIITMSAPALGGPVRLTGGTKATLDGKPAGELILAASAAGLLDELGRLKPAAMKDLRAKVDLNGTSTALLQPLASMMNLPLDMSQDIGPSVDLSLTANSAALSSDTTAAGSATLPPIDALFKLASRNINADASISLGESIRTVGNGVVLTVDSAAPLIQRFLASGSPTSAGSAAEPGSIDIAGRGKLELSITDLVLDMNVLMPRPAPGQPPKPMDLAALLQSTRAQANVRVDDLSVTMIPPPASPDASKGTLAPGTTAAPAPIVLSRATLSTILKPGSEPRVTLDSSLSHSGSPFSIAASLNAPASVLTKPAANVNAAPISPIQQVLDLRPTLQAELKNVPRSLTSVVPSLASALDAGDAKDVNAEVKRMLGGLIGDKVDATLTSAPDAPAAASGSAQTLAVTLTSTGINAAVDALVTPAVATLRRVSLEASLTPANTAGLFAALSAPPEPKPGQPAAAPKPAMALAAPFTLRLAVDPYSLPLLTSKEGAVSPNWDAAPELGASITTSAPVTIQNVSVSESSVAASLRNMSATARVPLAKMMGTNRDGGIAPAKVLAELVRVDGGRTDPVAKLDVDAQVPLGDAANLAAVVKLIDVNTGAADSIFGKPGFLVGALGDRLQANVRVQQASVAGGANTPGAKRTDIDAALESPRLTGATIRASMDDAAIRADSAKLVWTPSVEWVNDNLFGEAEARKNNTQPGAVLAKETSFTLDLKKLVLAASKSEGDRAVQGPLKPGVFGLDTSLTSPGMTLRRPDGKTVQLDDIRAALTGGATASSIGFDVNIARVSGDGSDGSKPSRIVGSLDKLAGADGVLTPDSAEITADGSMESLPTALVDALANQNGTIVDALGSILNLNLKAQRLSKTGGTIDLTSTAPRLNAKVIGKIENDTFIQTGPIEANITEIVEPLVKRFAGGVPLVENIIKTAQDEKGFVKAQNFTFPADGKDMTKFNGVITVDLGTAQFEAQGFFNQLLKLTGGRRAGVVGRKIEPFTVRADRGVLTYDRFTFPLGEFSVETRGTVDLVNRRINVVTYVPLLGLADETIGLLGAGGLLSNLNVLDRNTLVPIKISGSLDNPKAQPDAETFLKENAAKLVPDPKKILEDPGKAMEDLLKKPKKDK